ncbi:hypothetical protein KDW55_24995 [Burkholderia sp. AU19243]|uniref:hypothetical protein n=1 Tax=Burkholderia TaxID=32008 RepID=UPI0008421092|nr:MULTISPECIES: hypothetical protein [Burkholderia]MBR8144880.1 hypothetical protein [Burkholderia vietnamiensis]AOK07994.1 hypothetical protein WK25_26535 [Burkholderia latens]MBR8366577.1 hypothetical protein [Burkholderia sp. AU19243]MBY4694881.1 hypothetical protein [Burkholderia latens]MCA8310917.1 hypothetical protein [Burkholderia sp. AU28942]
MSEADDRLVLATLARLKRVREMRSQIARVAAARQQGIAAQSRRALDAAHAQLAQQVAAKAAIQTRLAGDVREARALQNAAADTRTFDRHIGVANASVSEAAHVHRDHEATLAGLQRAARKAKAAEDKLDKAGEKALHARAARVERDADEVADAHAVRRFATAGVWAGDADGASSSAGLAAAFDAEMSGNAVEAGAPHEASATDSNAQAAATAPTAEAAAISASAPADDTAAAAAPAAAERRC